MILTPATVEARVLLTGAAGVGAHATASAASGAPAASLTTTSAQSLIGAVGEDPSHVTARTAAGGQSLVADSTDSAGSDTFWTQKVTSSVNGLTGYGTAQAYAYNGDGLRMSETTGTATTAFAWDQSGSLPLLIAAGSTYYIGANVGGEVCNWVGDGWSATTRQLNAGPGVGIEVGPSGGYTIAVDPNATSPQSLEGGSVQVAGTANFSGGVQGSLSNNGEGNAGAAGPTFGLPGFSESVNGANTWVLNSSTGYSSSLVPGWLSSAYAAVARSLTCTGQVYESNPAAFPILYLSGAL